jgi:hypothetical protein
MKYPIFFILGDRGSGKSLTMAYLADQYYKAGNKIAANFELKKTPYRYIDYEELATIPEDLTDAVLFLDEIDRGVDSYTFLSKPSRAIDAFVTQIRKRRVTLFYASQRYKYPAKRLRDQTDYVWLMKPSPIDGIIHSELWNNEAEGTYIKTINMDLRRYFSYYNTDEIITFSKDLVKPGIKM